MTTRVASAESRASVASESSRSDGGITLIYCGADMPWRELQTHGFRRRNTCLLQALANRPEIERVIVINSVTRVNYRRWAKRSGPDAESKVSDLYVTRALPERRWAPGSAWINRALARRSVRRALPETSPARTFLWIYWPGGYAISQWLGLEGRMIFDADNDLLSCPNLAEGRESRLALMRELCGRADAIVCASERLLAWCAERGARCVERLRNGIDLDRFTNAPAIETAPELAEIPRPRLGYIGAISRWMDFDLVAELVRRRPEWSFVFVGEAYRAEIPAALRDAPNAHWLGGRRADEIPSLLRGFDVGLVPYREGEGANSDGDSMKIYEYLAAGAPVVSARYHDCLGEDFELLIRLASGADEFESEIEDSLDMSAAARERWHDARRAFLRGHTWDARARQAVALLKELA